MDKSIPALLGIADEMAEFIADLVAKELKVAIIEHDSPAAIKAATLKAVSSKIETSWETSFGSSDAKWKHGTVIGFAGMVVEQAYAAAVIAAKNPHSFGPLFKNAKK